MVGNAGRTWLRRIAGGESDTGTVARALAAWKKSATAPDMANRPNKFLMPLTVQDFHPHVEPYAGSSYL